MATDQFVNALPVAPTVGDLDSLVQEGQKLG
jgi:hypothetical protein